MVKKSKKQMIWEKEKCQQKDQKSQLQSSINEIEKNKSKISFGNLEQIQEAQLMQCIQQSNKSMNQHKIKEQMNNSELKTDSVSKESQYFQLTQKLIETLNEDIYKNIVINQFIQTNQSIACNQKCLNFNLKSKQSVFHQFPIRKSQTKRIIEFFQDQPLGVSKSYCQLPHFGLKQTKYSDKKRLINNYNIILLDLSSIKYLNIYGPTGSGKTFTLKEIIRYKQNNEKIIWLNGMNIIHGKKKKFISNLRQSFDRLLWQKYVLQKQNQKKSSLNQFFSKKNSKILVIDEFDQTSQFQFLDLLRWAYLTELKKQSNKELCFIQKIILISNNFECLTQGFYEKLFSLSKFQSNKSQCLFIQSLVFQPFSLQDAQKIIQVKIGKVNQIFSNYIKNQKGDKQKNMLKQMFSLAQYGIFTENKIKQIIKRISYSQDIDIRKILLFYVNSLKKMIQRLSSQINHQNSQVSKIISPLFKKFQLSIIEEDFVLKELFSFNETQTKNSRKSLEQQNPGAFYISQLQMEGKRILKIILEVLNEQKKLHNLSHYNDNLKLIKQKIALQNDYETFPQFHSSLNCIQRKINTLFIEDIIRKMKQKVNLQKLYAWIYQWRQIGLLKIQQTKQILTGQFYIKPRASIRMPQNIKIQVVDLQSIKKGFGI